MIINDSFEFPPNLMVADVIYQPFETPFLRLVRSRGLKAVNGLGMLLFQAAAAFELWTGKEMPSQEIWQALEKNTSLNKTGDFMKLNVNLPRKPYDIIIEKVVCQKWDNGLRNFGNHKKLL